MTGGGTARSNDTEQMMEAYENVFGPAVRDIKFDMQRQKRHQRWHLSDALKGASPFLTDRVDGLIPSYQRHMNETTASRGTNQISRKRTCRMYVL